MLKFAAESPKRYHGWRPWLFILFFVAISFHLSYADVGKAVRWLPPFTPTVCFGSDTSAFPSSYLFAAAGNGVWNDDLSCGQEYLIRCVSAEAPGQCKNPSQTISVTIVDCVCASMSGFSANDAALHLPNAAFDALATASTKVMYLEIKGPVVRR